MLLGLSEIPCDVWAMALQCSGYSSLKRGRWWGGGGGE